MAATRSSSGEGTCAPSRAVGVVEVEEHGVSPLLFVSVFSLLVIVYHARVHACCFVVAWYVYLMGSCRSRVKEVSDVMLVREVPFDSQAAYFGLVLLS